MWGLQQYIFTEIQTKIVTGNWQDLPDSFIKSVTIYSVREGPCNNFMEYITIAITHKGSYATKDNTTKNICISFIPFFAANMKKVIGDQTLEQSTYS